MAGLNLIYSSLALDGGSLKETKGCSQWFLSGEAHEKPTARRVQARGTQGKQM